MDHMGQREESRPSAPPSPFPPKSPFSPSRGSFALGQPAKNSEGETPSLPPSFLSFQLLLCAPADPGVGVGTGGGSFVRRTPGRRRRELLAGIAAAKDGLGLGGGGSRKRGEGDHWHRLRRRRYRWRRRRRRRKERSQGVRGRRVGRLPFSEENGEGTHTPVVNVEFRNCSYMGVRIVTLCSTWSLMNFPFLF